MRTILRFMMAMLVPLSIGFTASAQGTGGTGGTTGTTLVDSWTEVPKDNFISGAKKKQTSTDNDAIKKGDTFIMKVDTEFFPEHYGAHASDNTHDNTYVKSSYCASQLTGNDGTAKSTNLFQKSIEAVYKLTGIDAYAHLRDHKEKGASGDTENIKKRSGKLYAYRGELTRFFFIERNHDLALTGGGTNSRYYNPYKYTSDGTGVTGHMVPSTDGNFCEYGVDPMDLTYGTDLAKRAITRDWQDAFASSTTKNLSEILGKTFSSYNKYGCVAMTHDCSGGTLRSHWVHSNPPNVTNNLNPTTTTTDSQYAAFKADKMTSSGESTILFFVPNKTGCSAPGDWCVTSGDMHIIKEFAPYIQYYLAAFDKSGCYEGTLTGTDQTHELLWFTNVHDKLCPDYAPTETTKTETTGNGKNQKTETVQVTYYIGDNDYVAITPQYKSPKEIYKVSYRYHYEPDMEEYWKDCTVFYETTDEQGNPKSVKDSTAFKVNKIWPRERDDYWVYYKVECIIPSLGVSTVTNQIKLIVPGLNSTGTDMLLDVESSSVPVDNTSRTPGSETASYGENHITHHLDVTLSSKIRGKDGTYTITRNYKDSGEETTLGQTQVMTITVDNGTFTCKIGETEYEYGEEKTYFFGSNNHLYVKWPTTHNIDYAEADHGENWDKYKVEFESKDEYPITEGTTEPTAKITDSTSEVLAPVYYTTFRTEVFDNKVVSQSNTQYVYDATDKSVFEGCLAYRYIVRKGDQKLKDGEWKDGGNTQVESNPVILTTQQLTSAADVETTLYYCGYIEYNSANDIRGIWGIGDNSTVHKPNGKSSTTVTVKTIPHNQILDVTMGTGGSQSHPIWEYPEGKESTKQIFPGVDFVITGDNLPLGTGTYNVAFGLVIYEKVNGTWVRKTTHGEEYFNKIKDGTLNKYDATTNVWTPDFETSEEVAKTVPNITITQNVVYDFVNKPCKYDAFAFYVDPTSKEVKHYSHSGSAYITSTVAYDSQAYIAKLPNVVGEPVQFENTQGILVEEGINQLKPEDLKAYTLYHGNKDVENDGFAYFVLDLKNAIPERDANYDPDHKISRSENLIDAVTSYKITATQENNESEGEPRLKVFRPTLDYKKDTQEFVFDYAAYKGSQRPPIQGTSWQSAALNDSLQVYYEYIPVTTESGTTQTYSLVEGVNPTSAPSTIDKMVCAGNTHTLIGLRNIDLQTDVWTYSNTDDPGSKGALRKNVKPNPGEKYLKNAITFLVEPEFTIACPELPLFSFGGSYQKTTPPTYVNDETLGTTVKNQVPVIGNKNPIPDPRKILDYFAHMKYDHPELDRVLSPYVVTTSIVSGAETINSENVKVFADGRDILVEGAEGEVIVFNAYGQSVYAGRSSRIAMAQPGVYLVAANGSIYKVFVK